MSKLVSFGERVINVPSWSLAMNIIISVQLLAKKQGIKQSKLLHIAIMDYHAKHGEEVFSPIHGYEDEAV